MDMSKSLTAGAIGSLAFITLHESARRLDEEAPRMDILGIRALNKVWPSPKEDFYSDEKVYYTWLAGEILANAAWFSLVGTAGKKAPSAGVALALALGFGVLTLSSPLDIGRPFSRVPQGQKIKTLAWYLVAGLAAGATYTWLTKKESSSR